MGFVSGDMPWRPDYWLEKKLEYAGRRWMLTPAVSGQGRQRAVVITKCLIIFYRCTTFQSGSNM